MKKHFNIFVGLGSTLMLFGLLYLIVNLNDGSIKFALPVILSGVSLISVYLFMLDKTSILRHIKR
ncbi:MAG: hypothetical protein HF314_10190 [Ignavibacteria bacterium]|nr:hypothetical protein [Ignavibacteria bacterium]MCU7503435.1 hypothetical protein [Ignavibacteria bacterium]MCU7516233.1 hypothetical protein [Ignavibacteria bacterium]